MGTSNELALGSVIQPRCRARFTAEDVEFVMEVLGKDPDDEKALAQLLTDDSSRDLILDDESLFKAVLERTHCLSISSHLYFYVLVRRVLRDSGVRDRDVADYVAELLASYAQPGAAGKGGLLAAGSQQTFVEMLFASHQGDRHSSFVIRAHVGDTALFLCGMYPERIAARSRRTGAPGLSYYESLGQQQYAIASNDRLAEEYDVADVLAKLADQFRGTRTALNDLSDRLISLGDSQQDSHLLNPGSSRSKGGLE
jgi:hypothetical protein